VPVEVRAVKAFKKYIEAYLWSQDTLPYPLYLSLYKIVSVCPKPFKLRFWEIRPEAWEALGPDLWKRSIHGASSGLLAP
jgi:hypothetical protein